MCAFLKNIVRHSRLKKFRSPVETGFVSMKEMKKALVILDGTEEGCVDYGRQMAGFFQSNGITATLLYVDLRKAKERIEKPCEGEFSLLRKGINWFGMPKPKLYGETLLAETDLLVNLCDEHSFTYDFISHCVPARFKIGTIAYEGNPFDLVCARKEEEPVLNEEDGTPVAPEKKTGEKISTICNFLKQIV